MVDRVERNTARPREPLRGACADEQASDQPRAHARRDAVDIADSDACLAQRALDHRDQPLEMRAACDLGHDAAELAVKLVLRRHNARAHAQRVVDDRRRGLVTGTFDAEDASHGKTW